MYILFNNVEQMRVPRLNTLLRENKKYRGVCFLNYKVNPRHHFILFEGFTIHSFMQQFLCMSKLLEILLVRIEALFCTPECLLYSHTSGESKPP